MKKVIYSCAVILAFGFAACSGSGKTDANLDSTDSLAVESTEDEAPEEIIIADGYNITKKGIVPTGGRPMIVDFTADWCQPCQDLKPIFANLKNDFIGRIDCVTINTDENKELVKKYGIRNIPTLLFLTKTGEIKKQTTGYIPRDSINVIIDSVYNHLR